MLGTLTQGLCLVNYRRVCAWLVSTGIVLGKLTEGSHLISYHRVCAWQVYSGFALAKLTQCLCLAS